MGPHLDSTGAIRECGASPGTWSSPTEEKEKEASERLILMSTLAPNCWWEKQREDPPPLASTLMWIPSRSGKEGSLPVTQATSPLPLGLEELSSHILPSPSYSPVKSRSRWDVK